MPLSAPSPQLVRFPCQHCGRIVQATETHFSSQRCPHCQQLLVVPESVASPPAAPPPIQGSPPPKPAANAADPEMWGPGEAAPVQQEQYIPVHCRVCDTRMYATVAQVGSEIPCPDCGAKTKVVMPKQKSGLAPPIAIPGEGYEVSEPPVQLTLEIVGYGLPPVEKQAEKNTGQSAQPKSKSKGKGQRKNTSLPKAWLVRGVFPPAFLASAVGTCVLTVALLSVSPILLQLALVLSSSGFMAVAGVIGLVVSGLVAMIAAAYFGNLLIAILETASDGQDSVEAEMEQMFVDRLWRSLFIFIAWFYACLPGTLAYYLLDSLVGESAMTGWMLFMLASVFLLLPITQLSVMEATSLGVPLSMNILRAMRLCWKAWLGFYLVSLPLCLAGGFLLRAVLQRALASSLGSFFLIHPLSCGALALIAIVTLVSYYRVLGRLACYCAERIPARDNTEPVDFTDPYRPIY